MLVINIMFKYLLNKSREICNEDGADTESSEISDCSEILDFSVLEKNLSKLGEVQLSDEVKAELKQHLLSNLSANSSKGFVSLELEKLKKAIINVGNETIIPSWSRFMMRERVLEYIENSTKWNADVCGEYQGTRFGSFLKSAVTMALLFIIVVSSVLVFPFNVKVVHAKATYLDEVVGDVKIVRKTRIIKALDNALLEEGDTILTEHGGFATIKFLDESLSRLDEDTSLELRRLHREPMRPVVTNVELFIKKGRLWTRVFGIFDESSFVVNTPVMAADARKKAAFDLYSDDSKTELTVFDNVVDIKSGAGSESKSKTLIAGYKAQVTGPSLGDLKIEKIPRNEMINTENKWVGTNLVNDQVYKDELVEVKERQIDESSDKEVNDDEITYLGDGSVFPDEELESLRLKFLDGYKLLVNAEAQLVRGNRSEAVKELKKFKNVTAVVLTRMKDAGEREPVYAGLLRALMEEKIAIQLQDFASFLPGDRLYNAKETLQEVEIMIAETELDKIKIRLKQAEGMLFEVQELLEDGKYNLASTLLKRYQNHTNGLSLTFSEQNVKELKDSFVSLLERQFDHIKILTAIEKSIYYKDLEDFQERVKLVREDVLRKFVIAIENHDNAREGDLISSVRDLMEMYIEEENGNESDLVDPVLDKITDGSDGGVNFIHPAEVMPEGLGILVMVSEEATGEVGLE